MTRLAPGFGIHRFGGTSVRVYTDGADAVLPDGAEMHARAPTTGAALITAILLGYNGDTRVMVREWAYLHAQLCHVLGLPASPVLTEFARGRVAGTPVADAECEMVAAAMKFLNAWRAAGKP